jgi:CTP:molybdopterin cytidylyltransferase MocA
MGCLLKQGGGLYPRLRIGAVLLAAGEGRRMEPGQTIDTASGVPLISRQLVALSGAGVDEVVVVTGHARNAIEEQVRSFSVTLAQRGARPRAGKLRANRAGRAQRKL